MKRNIHLHPQTPPSKKSGCLLSGERENKTETTSRRLELMMNPNFPGIHQSCGIRFAKEASISSTYEARNSVRW